MKKQKTILCTACAILLLVGTLLSASSCSSRAPSTAEIYDRAVELIENAHTLNTIFYGEGLPVHALDSEYAEIMRIYQDDPNAGVYEAVSERAILLSALEIQYAAEKVYSKDYLEEVIYPALFTGYAINGADGRPHFSHARYLEEREWIYQYAGDKITTASRLIYDFSTMRVVKPSSATLCFLEITCYPADAPEQARTRRLSLVLQDGEWYLDSFTG